MSSDRTHRISDETAQKILDELKRRMDEKKAEPKPKSKD